MSMDVELVAVIDTDCGGPLGTANVYMDGENSI